VSPGQNGSGPDFADRPVVAITGAHGLVGGAVARAFAARGYGVRGLVRTPGRPAPVSDGWQEHVGDLTDPASLRGLCDGADTVVHTAAIVSDWDREEIFWRINRDGTRTLLDEAQRSGVRRFVYVSTADVFGFRTDIEIDEAAPKQCPPYPYSLSKLEGERLVWQRSGRQIEVSVIYPTWVFGPGDRHLVPELVDGLRTRQMVYFDRGRTPLELTYSENLGEAIALVATSDEAAGEDYIVGDEYGATFGDFLDLLAEHSGLKPPRFSLPIPVALGVAAASETVARATRSSKRPLLTRYAIRSAASGMRYRLDKVHALGYSPRVGLEEGIQWTLAELAGAEEEARWTAPAQS
jgi:nucleoside-diphosphate-sugar epimerase